MAKRFQPPPAPEPRQFPSVREVDQAIGKLQRRIDQLKGLDPQSTRHDDPRVDVARRDIVNTVLEVFGPNSPEQPERSK